MKLMVISDIHGGIEYLKKAVEKYKEEKADRLAILGDFSSYYNPSIEYEIYELLNSMADKICAVKGNCDNDEIEKYLAFSLMEIRSINLNDNVITLTHGDKFNKYNLPDFCGDILLTGHTHYGIIEKKDDRIYANPGSISKPRNGAKRTYLIIDEEKIYLKDLDGNILIYEEL